MTVVDGGKGFCDAIKARHPQIEVVNSLFEEFRGPPAFQSIVMGHVLEHVENPVEILALARNWLAPGAHPGGGSQCPVAAPAGGDDHGPAPA